ncbi:hypothetical protein HKBW3C_03040, partial [Candidatus Hakubella thermalkaliphila]
SLKFPSTLSDENGDMYLNTYETKGVPSDH